MFDVMQPGARITLLAALALAACTTAPRLDPPKVGVARVQIDRFTGANAQFSVVVTLANPNDREIAVDAIAADLRIENVAVGTARLAAPVRLPPRGETRATIAAQTDLAASLRAAAEIARRLETRTDGPPAVRYAVSGYATLDGGSVVPFSRSGEFTLKLGAPDAP